MVNVQANDRVALNLTASSWLIKIVSIFHLTHFHLLKLCLYLAYSKSNIHHAITSHLCEWQTFFMTSAVLLQGQIWPLYLQCEVVTNVHQTDTLLTHKCWKAITWLDTEIQRLHLIRPISLVTSCWLTYYINHGKISGCTHAGTVAGSDEIVCKIKRGHCTFRWSLTSSHFHSHSVTEHSVTCAWQQDVLYSNLLVCELQLFLKNCLKNENS